MEQGSFQWEAESRIYTVGELNGAIHSLLEREFQDIWVAGEISGVKLAASGHYYFTLKEDNAQLRCVCFRMTARYLRFKPQDGIAALARGRVDVYEARGEYQLLVEALEPQGYGALQLAFEQLKKKLAEEGIFDASRKRALPRFPRRIGIVTSPRGAVIRDMLQILERRFPGLHVRIYPALVQGEGASGEVTAGIEWFSMSGWPDLVIVARGGGSPEDLWTFNDEKVARAIARCSVPVVSAIGHETDVTIADFVADLRAPTPSAAAELTVCTKQEIFDRLYDAARKLRQNLRYRITDGARRLNEQGIGQATVTLQRGIGRRLQRVDDLDYRLRDLIRACITSWARTLRDRDGRLRKLDLQLRLFVSRRRMEMAETVARQRISLRFVRERGRLDTLSMQLAQLSPLRILERGYAIVEDDQRRIIKDAAAAPALSMIDVRLARGCLQARVTLSTPDGSSELPS